MSQIVIYTDDPSCGHYFESVMNTMLDNACEITDDASHVKSVSDSAALIIIDMKAQHGHDLIEYCHQQATAKPLFIVGDQDSLWQAKKIYKTRTLQEYLSYDSSLDHIETVLHKMMRVSSRANRKTTYCKVNLNFFSYTSEVFCDVYLKLKDDKYVKVFNRYDRVSRADFDKYKGKRIHHLYVKERDFQYITKQLVKQLRHVDQGELSLMQTGGSKISALLSIQLQETVAESLHSIGLNQDAIEMASIAVNSTLNLVEATPHLYDMLQASLKGHNYIAEHSFMLAYLACAVCRQAGLSVEGNLQSITLAAFFHDIALTSDDMAKVQNEQERDFERLGIEEQEEVLNHGDKALELMEQIEGVSQESLTIVAQHHECYDGTGFPRGIDYRQISPLSAIFNVCHELCLYIYESGSQEQHVADLIDSMSERYQKGSYKSAIDALERVFFFQRDQRKNLAS